MTDANLIATLYLFGWVSLVLVITKHAMLDDWSDFDGE